MEVSLAAGAERPRLHVVSICCTEVEYSRMHVPNVNIIRKVFCTCSMVPGHTVSSHWHGTGIKPDSMYQDFDNIFEALTFENALELPS